MIDISKKGVMIAGHGSTMAYNKGVMEMQASKLRDMGYDNVYIGFNETSFPSIRESLEEMVADGYDDILVLPFFVASGMHVVRDIPMKHMGLPWESTGGEVDVDGRKVNVRIDPPFGDDPNLTSILADRIEELRTPGRNTYIMIMGHGSRLRYNSEVMEINAERLRDMGYDNVYIGYNEFNDPKIEDIALEMMDSGADEIVALPLFMTLGKHLTMDVPAKLGIEDFSDGGLVHRNGRDIEVKYAVPIGADPRLTEVLAKKIATFMG